MAELQGIKTTESSKLSVPKKSAYVFENHSFIDDKPNGIEHTVNVSVTCTLFEYWIEENEQRHDKTNKVTVRPAKTRISLCIRPVWSESSMCAQWVAKGPLFLHADSEDSDQIGRMPKLIWVFAGRTLILLVLSCRGSNMKLQ